MLLLDIDRRSPMPAYRQLCDHVARLVAEGTLAPGMRLPPTRQLAAALGVHRTTVVRAYRELRATGVLESRPGSYTTVRRRWRVPLHERPTDGSEDAARARRVARREPVRAPRRAAPPAPRPPASDPRPRIDLATHIPDPVLEPHRDLRRAVKRVLAGAGVARLSQYADPQGEPDLRLAIARRMARHGVAVAPGEILVTAGAQHALDLILRWRTAPGTAVAIESPGYGMALQLLRQHRARIVPVPMAADGLDVARLGRVLATHRPALLYTMPNFHNPTGITTSAAHREALLALCERYGTHIVEDGFDEELDYAGPAALPIKSIDLHGIVLYLGTLSKLVYPGLRIGWIAAPRAAIAPLTALNRVTSLGGAVLNQAIAAQLLRSTAFDVHLRRVHRTYQRRLRSLFDGLAAHLPRGISWTRPAGGYLLWLTVPAAAAHEGTIVERLARAGVEVTPGAPLHVRRSPHAHLRLSIACADEAAIADGCRHLGEVLRPFAPRAARATHATRATRPPNVT